MAGPVKEWDEYGNPVQSQAVREWDEHGNPVSSSQGQTGAQPSMSLDRAFQVPSVGLGAKETVTGEQSRQPLTLQRPGVLQRFQDAAQSRVSQAQEQGVRGEISPMQAGMETFTGGAFRDLAGLAGQPTESIKNAALTAGAMIPGVRTALAPYFMYQGAKTAMQPQQAGETSADRLQRALLGGSMVAGGAAQAASGIKSGAGAVKDAYSAYGTAQDVKAIGQADAANFRESLRASTEDALTKETIPAKQKLWDAYNQVGQRYAALKKDVVASDYAAGEPAVSMSDMWPKMDELATSFKAAGGKLPKFDAAVQAISNRVNPVLWLDEALNLKSEIGDLWSKAAAGTRDAEAVKGLYDSLSNKISARAEEVGQAKKLGAMNDLWSLLMKYKQGGESLPQGQMMQGGLGKLLNAQSGNDFLSVLRDPQYAGELGRTFNSLEDFGLKKNFKADIVNRTAKAHDFLQTKSADGIMGRWKAVMKHPAVAVPAMVAGKATGGMIGGAIGAIKAADVAEQIQGLRALRGLGGPPSRAGEMKASAQVQPEGLEASKPEAAAGPAPSDVSDLVGALREQGMDTKTAKAVAIQALKDNPGNFDAALRQALRGSR